MNDEQDNQASPPPSPADDPRFEVKWQKKNPGQSAPPPTPSPDVAGDVAADVRRQLDEAEQRITELQDRWHRAAADLANLRKRTEQERGESEKLAGMMVIAELLPVLDNFERALNAIPGNLAMLTWIQGIVLIERHMRAIFDQRGVAPIEAEGKMFDPYQHEAIAEEISDAVPPGHVVRVLQTGYLMHGRVIRPALVEIAVAPPQVTPKVNETTERQAEDIAEVAEIENTGP